MSPNHRVCQSNVCRKRAARAEGGVMLCTVDGRDIRQHADEGDCPLGMFHHGLGDWVETVLRKTYIGPLVKRVVKAVTGKPCGGCRKRQAAMNRVAPFNQVR